MRLAGLWTGKFSDGRIVTARVATSQAATLQFAALRQQSTQSSRLMTVLWTR